MADTYARPFSTASVISPHHALEALAAKDRLSYPPSSDEVEPSPRASPLCSQTAQSPPRVNGTTSQSPNRTPQSVNTSRPSGGAAGPSRNGNGAGQRNSYSAQQLENELAGRTFVRALFDFEATDPSALSFQTGDIIEVITRLESGWWDGLLGRERGWFPSNFVKAVDSRDIIDEITLEDDEQSAATGTSGVQGSTRAGQGSNRLSESRETLQTPAELGGGEDDLDLEAMLQRGNWGGATALEDLAKEMMGHNVGDDGSGFQVAADERRKKLGVDLGKGDELQMAAEDRHRRQLGPPLEFGRREEGSGSGSTRRREQTNDTIRALQPSPMPRPAPTLDTRTPEDTRDETDAWIPSMTADGQVYYHNELTGEDAWELPKGLSSEDSDAYGAEDDPFYNSFTSIDGPSSAAYARTTAQFGFEDEDAKQAVTNPETFAPPPKSIDLPEPWTAKMTDDGREWYYVNRITGHTRRTPPSPTLKGVSDRVKRLSVASIPPSTAPQQRPLQPRRSLDMKRRQVSEWSHRTRERMQAAIPTQQAPPTMGYLVEMVNEALREVFEACVAGSAAEEELARADDLGSDAGVTLGLEREEAAEEMLKIAHLSTLAAIRELFSSFKYVGPLDTDPDMPRPTWVGNMALIGSIGLLSANVHAATVSHRLPDSGLSVWAEVMRAGSKLKDVIALFPAAVTPGKESQVQDAVQGTSRGAQLGGEGVGRIMGGKWGFGEVLKDTPALRNLDQSVVADLSKAKTDFEARPKSSDRILDNVRAIEAFRTALLLIDVASGIDLDGDTSSEANADHAEKYADLVGQAQSTLIDLEACHNLIVKSCTALLDRKAELITLELIPPTLDASIRAISSLLKISSSQRSMIEQSFVLGQLGHRSPLYKPPVRRPLSMASSRQSRQSYPRRTARGLEEEFLASGEYDDESRDQAGELVSASASGSQTSLSAMQGNRRGMQVSTNVQPIAAGPGEISATSSTTSLTYQKSESDSGSLRGKRSSIMKFMRGKSGSDADDVRNRPRQASKKLAKLLGEDFSALGQLPPPLAPPTQKAPETPWYLGDDYEPSELLFDDKGAVRAGTLSALVARLTPYGSTDTSFFQAFMLTFRSFTSSQELLKNLLERYYIQPPVGLTSAELSDWAKQKQTPIRLRVCNTLRAWLDKYYVDKLDALLLDRLERFAEDESRTLAAQQLKGLVQRRRKGEPDVQRRIVSGGLLSPPAPLIPRVPPGREMSILDIAPLELARQLTIVESGFFQRVQPSECLNKAWNGDNGDKLAPNVRSVIRTANILSGWVGTTCLSSRDPKQRARVMKHYVQIAIELRNLNNFSSMAAIAAGLNTAPVIRLKRSWELCSPKTQAQKADVDKTLDSTKNFSNYKDMLKTINPPCVPFFGFWLSALTFIEDGNKDFVANPSNIGSSQPSAGGLSTSASSLSLVASVARAGPSSETVPPPLINFFKRSLAAEILRDIQQYQSQPYNLAKSRTVYDWLMKSLEHCDRTYDLDRMYNLSLQLEPREREEERITRMLHDSGFI